MTDLEDRGRKVGRRGRGQTKKERFLAALGMTVKVNVTVEVTVKVKDEFPYEGLRTKASRAT